MLWLDLANLRNIDSFLLNKVMLSLCDKDLFDRF